jgi:hypothetical protein
MHERIVHSHQIYPIVWEYGGTPYAYFVDITLL